MIVGVRSRQREAPFIDTKRLPARNDAPACSASRDGATHLLVGAAGILTRFGVGFAGTTGAAIGKLGPGNSRVGVLTGWGR